ncbi:MAG: hypothetical protein OXO49_09570 [Gammaproteobacteria bacterium]|nr:hypothetical protein [Gammaproteobacteria bacterium]MDE0253134.1 hypothetical protein [Gammaproteobacteria bacterium]MDE0402359.1 hypothetical protein [Gammaproteobacteria bacterium]
MKTASRKLWLGASGLGLIGLAIGVFLWLSTPRSIPAELPDIPSATNLSASPPPTAPTVVDSPPVTLTSPTLPPIDYPPGSIGHECGVNEFPPYHWYSNQDSVARRGLANSPYDSNGDWKELEGECQAALDNQFNATNPYLWFDATKNRLFAFVVIDKPLTFARLFADPVGDLARVQEALARPECQLGENAESNWQLHETCHADALLNYALITRFCYNDGVRNRTRQYYWEEDNPTPTQDRSMWIQRLEGAWVDLQCESLDPTLNLQSEVHTELRVQLRMLYPAAPKRDLDGILIELAARLGDDAAALTRTVIRLYDKIYSDEGYKHGRFADWFTNLFEPTKLFTKHPPSVDRLRQILPLFSKNIGAGGGSFMVIDHEALVQHLCTPPYFTNLSEDDIIADSDSCRTVINELRLQIDNNRVMQELIATFEDVAMRLEVYE